MRVKLLITVVALCLVPAAPAYARKHSSCAAQKGVTLAQNSRWRVLQRAGKHDAIDFYACRSGGRATLRLLRTPLTTEETDRVFDVTIAGDYVAMRGGWETGVAEGDFAEVFDLRARRHSYFAPPDGENFAAIWLAGNGSLLVDVVVNTAHRLDAYDAAGRTTLESSPFDDPAVGKARAYWQTAAGAKSAPLGGFAAATAKRF